MKQILYNDPRNPKMVSLNCPGGKIVAAYSVEEQESAERKASWYHQLVSPDQLPTTIRSGAELKAIIGKNLMESFSMENPSTRKWSFFHELQAILGLSKDVHNGNFNSVFGGASIYTTSALLARMQMTLVDWKAPKFQKPDEYKEMTVYFAKITVADGRTVYWLKGSIPWLQRESEDYMRLRHSGFKGESQCSSQENHRSDKLTGRTKEHLIIQRDVGKQKVLTIHEWDHFDRLMPDEGLPIEVKTVRVPSNAADQSVLPIDQMRNLLWVAKYNDFRLVVITHTEDTDKKKIVRHVHTNYQVPGKEKIKRALDVANKKIDGIFSQLIKKNLSYGQLYLRAQGGLDIQSLSRENFVKRVAGKATNAEGIMKHHRNLLEQLQAMGRID